VKVDAEQQPSLPLAKLTLHWQRLTIVVASIVGISSLFLPWFRFPTGEIFRETTPDGAIIATLFLLPFLTALIGRRTLPLSSVAGRCFTVIPGVLNTGVAILTGIFTNSFLLNALKQEHLNDRAGEELARSASPSIGPLVCFFAGAGIVIVSFLARRQKQHSTPVQRGREGRKMKKLIDLFVAGLVGFLIYLVGLLIYPNWDVITGVSHGFLDGIREMRGIKIQSPDMSGFKQAADEFEGAVGITAKWETRQRMEAELAKAQKKEFWADFGRGSFRIAREKFHAYLLIALLGVIFAFVYAKALSIRSRNRGHEKAK
jgi:hypothetical protein